MGRVYFAVAIRVAASIVEKQRSNALPPCLWTPNRRFDFDVGACERARRHAARQGCAVWHAGCGAGSVGAVRRETLRGRAGGGAAAGTVNRRPL